MQTPVNAPVFYFICNCLISFVLKELSCIHFPLSGTTCRGTKENEMPIGVGEWGMCGITGTILVLIAS